MTKLDDLAQEVMDALERQDVLLNEIRMLPIHNPALLPILDELEDCRERVVAGLAAAAKVKTRAK